MSLGKIFGWMLLVSLLAMIVITEFWGTDNDILRLVIGVMVASLIGLFLVMMGKRNVVVIRRDND